MKKMILILTLLVVYACNSGKDENIDNLYSSIQGLNIEDESFSALLTDMVSDIEKSLTSGNTDEATFLLDDLAMQVVNNAGTYYAKDGKLISPVLNSIIMMGKDNSLELMADGPHNDRRCDDNNKCTIKADFFICYQVGNGCAEYDMN
ncbi:hypothetical protein [Ekhidna sp.]|uniref:hypothetical protein n=1 Tax=Ekhidna sp. TaxID=2608089 RepID=UPI0032997FED